MKIKQRIKFSDNPKDTDDLANKVLSGGKTATSSLLDLYRLNKKEISKIDDLIAVLDSSDREVVAVRIIKMEIIRFKDITESFAKEEGDSNLDNWLNIHKPYYSKLLASIDSELTDNTELVCEWFEVV